MKIFARLITLLLTTLLISSCATFLPPSPLENHEKVTQIKSFPALKKRANIYFRLNDTGWDYPVKVIVDGQLLGVVAPNQSINFSIPSGAHHFTTKLALAKAPESSADYSDFDLNVTAGSLALIQCEGVQGFGVLTRTLEPVLRKKSECSPYEMSQKNGISACIKPYQNPSIELASEPWSTCALVDDKQVFLDSTFVKAHVVKFKGEQEKEDFEVAKLQNTVKAYQAYLRLYPSGKYHGEAQNRSESLVKNAYLQAERTHTVLAYQTFLNNHSTGQYSDIIRGKIQALKTDEQVNAVLQRYTGLPLQVRKDKVMLLLTNHLKHGQYKKSLLYFQVLDRMKVKLSPSFTYFWGEALVRTGQKEAGLKKLYTYIRQAGSQGQYYSQALSLSNEAEL